MRFYSRFLYLSIFICFVLSGLIIGCKGTANPLGHSGPFDNPTVTSTITNTPTVTNTQTVTSTPTNTSTPGPVNVSVVVNYQGTQNGINWNLVDPSGNTVGSSSTNNSNTPFSFNPSVYGTYSVNVPTQTRYLYSSTPITINGPGNYTATFTCSNQTLSANPSSLTYGSCIGCQIPVSLTYSYSGNLNVPVSVVSSGLASAFSISPSYVNLTSNGASQALTISKNSCVMSNSSNIFLTYDWSGNSSGFSITIPLNRSYSIPVSLVIESASEIPSFSNSYSSNINYSFNLEIIDNSLGCNTYPVSIFTYPAGGNGSINYTNATSVSSQSSFNLATNTYQNIHFYLTTPDGIVHDSGLLQEISSDTYTNAVGFSYFNYFISVGTLSNNYSIINENVATNNNVLISTSY